MTLRVGILGALCVIVAAGCGRDAEAPEATALTAEDLGTTAEARAYMADHGMVWSEGLTLAQVKSLVDAVYGAGAPEVVFARIEKLGGRDVSAWLVVKLPRTGRKAIFSAFNKALRKYGGTQATDTGQDYLDLPLD